MLKACQTLDKVLSNVVPFEIDIKELKAFPKWDKPRTLYLEVGNGRDKLKKLVKDLKTEWKEQNLTNIEESFSPHVCLGIWDDIYVKSSQGDILKVLSTKYLDLTIGTFLVTDVLLLNSELTSTTPIYSPVYLSRLNIKEPVKRRARYRSAPQFMGAGFVQQGVQNHQIQK
eukprot:TRINITY_DN12051_c0_g1_i2.p1 TRINITY_DN12051_c0_g1~~TRINITY_DN12051_c0_g1_i2.p1  ORF type:complete len:171 (+),score=39.24 TRINITY_DN12051_c0_g1_i2:54-566(+)